MIAPAPNINVTPQNDHLDIRNASVLPTTRDANIDTMIQTLTLAPKKLG